MCTEHPMEKKLTGGKTTSKSKDKNKLECQNEHPDILHMHIIQCLKIHGLFLQTALKVIESNTWHRATSMSMMHLCLQQQPFSFTITHCILHSSQETTTLCISAQTLTYLNEPPVT